LLLAATVRSFVHLPLGISDRNSRNPNKGREGSKNGSRRGDLNWDCAFSTLPLLICRAVSAALHAPQLGGPTLSQEPKIQSRHHLTPRKSFDPQIEIWKALEISEVKGPIERKYLHYSCFGPL